MSSEHKFWKWQQKHVGEITTLILLLIGSPILLVLGFGLYTIFHDGYILPFMGTLLIATFVIVGVRWHTKRTAEETTSSNLELSIEASEDWSLREKEIWDESKQFISTLLEESTPWSNIRKQGVAVSIMVAERFDVQPLAFSITEALKLTEEISRRYRAFLRENIPAIDSLKVNHITWIYGTQHKYGSTIKKAGTYGGFALRVARLINPLSAVASEIRGAVVDRVVGEISNNLKRNARKALLEEVAKTCIDLYSGRFSIEEDNVSISSAGLEDEKRRAFEFEPLRVTIVGQTSVGKSSIINALQKDFVAEIDQLPSTDNVTKYAFKFDGDNVLSLIDTPGLDGSQEISNLVLHEMTNSDVVLWVLKANQPAKALDLDQKNAFEAYFGNKENISRKRPIVIGVLNQIDRLPPQGEWDLPIDLEYPRTNKETTIVAALEHFEKLLSFDALVPISVSSNEPHYGVEVLESAIELQFTGAQNVQRNRQRHEARNRHNGIGKNCVRLFKGVKTVAETVRR